MTTPFGGAKIPFVMKLGTPTQSYTPDSSTTTHADGNIASLTFQDISGTFKWIVVWSHVAMSTSGTSTVIVRLFDYTNSTVLATINNTSSVSVNTDSSTFVATTQTFTKPATYAKFGILLNTSDTTARQVIIRESSIVIT